MLKRVFGVTYGNLAHQLSYSLGWLLYSIGLAAVLILVSFLYQRFMTGKDEEVKQEG